MWYLHFDKRETVLLLEICKICREKNGEVKGKKDEKDAEENEEL